MAPRTFDRELREALKRGGCVMVRQGKGSHEIWRAPSGRVFPVQVGIASRHTANAILKQAGLAKAF